MPTHVAARENLSDLIGTKELLKDIVQRLSSQLLLFSIAVMVLLIGTFFLFGQEGLPILIALLVVFLVGTIGYLFVEQKQKLEAGDPKTVSRLLGNRMAAISAPAAPADFAVELWTSRREGTGAASRDIGVQAVGVGAPAETPAYRVGDKIDIHFQATRSCYLTLLNIGTSGKLTLLFPNAQHPDNYIEAGRVHVIPGTTYGFEYVLQGPPGTEKLKAVATEERVELLETSFTAEGGVFMQEEMTAAARDIAVVKSKTEALPAQAWTEAYHEFEVRP